MRSLHSANDRFEWVVESDELMKEKDEEDDGDLLAYPVAEEVDPVTEEVELKVDLLPRHQEARGPRSKVAAATCHGNTREAWEESWQTTSVVGETPGYRPSREAAGAEFPAGLEEEELEASRGQTISNCIDYSTII